MKQQLKRLKSWKEDEKMETKKYRGQLTTYTTNTTINLVGSSPYDILEELNNRANQLITPDNIIYVKLIDIETKNILVKREYSPITGGGASLTFQYLAPEFQYTKPQTWVEE